MPSSQAGEETQLSGPGTFAFPPNTPTRPSVCPALLNTSISIEGNTNTKEGEVLLQFQSQPDFPQSGNGIGASLCWQTNHGRYLPQIHPHLTFDAQTPQIRLDILNMIVDYLQSEKLFTSAMVVTDEAEMKTKEMQQGWENRPEILKKLSKACTDGRWEECATILLKDLGLGRHTIKRLLYCLYKQEYLELIHKKEYQKAFNLLSKRSKQMEGRPSSPSGSSSGSRNRFKTPQNPRAAASTPSENSNSQEFKELCYLLSGKAVQDSPMFQGWGSEKESRENLVHELKAAIEVEDCLNIKQPQMPKGRLVMLLQQAVAYQMELCRYHPRIMPQVNSLSKDFASVLVPNTLRHTFVCNNKLNGPVQGKGEPSGPVEEDGPQSINDKASGLNQGGMKSFTYIGQEGCFLAAGLADGKVAVWKTNPTECSSDEQKERPDPGAGKTAPTFANLPFCVIQGTARRRIWDLISNKEGSLLVTGVADGSVELWSLRAESMGDFTDSYGDEEAECTGFSLCSQGTLKDSHQSDVYSVHLPNPGTLLATGSNDRVVRLFDLESWSQGNITETLKTFTGHQAGVSEVTSNPYGNLLVSGSRDGTIKFWDMMSGVSVKNISPSLGAVTSVQMSQSGMYLLGSFRHGPVRLWDLRMVEKPLQRYKGAHNCAGSFVRASFGLQDRAVICGSDDGKCFIWDLKTAKVLQILSGAHRGTVYHGRHCSAQQLLTTCGEDGTLRTWWWQEEDASFCPSRQFNANSSIIRSRSLSL